MTPYKKYDLYKDSGVEWLGEVPEHWEVLSLKYVLSRNDAGVWGNEPKGVNDSPILRSTEQDVLGNLVVKSPALRHLTHQEKQVTLLLEGDLIVTKSSGSQYHIGKTSLINSQVAALNCGFSNFMQRLRVKPSSNAVYTWYWLNSSPAKHSMTTMATTTTGLRNLNAEIIANTTFLTPPLPEQRAIADYLDRETAKIDALIDQKTRLVELLEEKRQATISHAVTKGLDPNAPMKDSGVPWLGEVPAHWEVRKLKFYGLTTGSGTTPKNESSYVDVEGIPWVTTSELRENRINTTKKQLSPYAFQTHSALTMHPTGSLLIAMYGATIGRLARLGIGATTNQACFAIHPTSSNIVDFLEFWFYGYRNEIIKMSIGAGQPNISAGLLRNLIIPIPTKQERAEIIDHLINIDQITKDLTHTINQSITLLREKRSALITAAVTGQIDVRGEVA